MKKPKATRITYGGITVTEETVVETAVDLAEMFQVSRQTIFDWKRKGMPQRDDGRYQFFDVFRWHVLHTGVVTAEERVGGLVEEMADLRAENERLRKQLTPEARRRK